MLDLQRVLIYEIFGYWPAALSILESTCRGMQSSLSSDLAYIHYFIEDMYKEEKVRTLDWA